MGSELKMEAIRLQCRNGSRFHLGETSLENSSDIVHADTLFSALATIYQLAYGDGAGFVNLVETGRLLFSSCFHVLIPSWSTKSRICFLPKPPVQYDMENRTDRKRCRRIQFVSVGTLRRISESLGTNGDKPVSSVSLAEGVLIGGTHVVQPDELKVENADIQFLASESFAERITMPHVDERKPTREDAFYHTTSLQFKPLRLDRDRVLEGHFYILVRHTLSENEHQRFLACLRILGDEGLGGERANGCGQFEGIEAMEAPSLPEKGRYTLSLSTVNPAGEEELQHALSYRTLLRGGGSLGRHGIQEHHRKQVYMMAEGALFDSSVVGRCIDISPEASMRSHPILRYGKNFAIGLGEQ